MSEISSIPVGASGAAIRLAREGDLKAAKSFAGKPRSYKKQISEKPQSAT
jgi:hypothetical protein